jgi:predicted RNase H-like HicB family nuclease
MPSGLSNPQERRPAVESVAFTVKAFPGPLPDGSWYVAYCAEVPGANGQGKSREECLANLREAIALILEHRREESLRALPPDAIQELVVVG